MNVPRDEGKPHAPRVSLGLPLIVLLLAFTAVPIEARFPNWYLLRTILFPRFDAYDLLSNVIGYVPIGAVLVNLPAKATIYIATAVSGFAEATQIFSQGRSPSFVDVATNLLGAALGWGICRLLNFRLTSIPVSRAVGAAAAIVAIGYVAVLPSTTPADIENDVVAFLAAPPWRTVNDRGASQPGRIEGHWPLDTSGDGLTADVSGAGLNGSLIDRPAAAEGMVGGGMEFDGLTQAIEVGDPLALRLVGSMTITAWVKARDFRSNDNAIVSSMNDAFRGFQLDVTTDQGPPAIGFKLTQPTGARMARYGATRLRRGQWYHVAGVYDAHAQTLNVFLNGRLDNGCLQGPVSPRQVISGMPTFIGRGRERNNFTGIVDDVKIFSKALSADALQSEIGVEGVPPAEGAVRDAYTGPCTPNIPLDARVAGFAVGLGVLVAVAGIGLSAGQIGAGVACGLGFAAGAALILGIGEAVPPSMRWFVPLFTLAGALSVVWPSPGAGLK